MRSIFFTLLITITITTSISAQTFGIKGGWSAANLATGNENISEEFTRNGFVVGAFINYDLGGIINFQPEILYVQKGADYNDLGISISSNLNYVEIPLGLQVNILEPLYFYAGPQVSYLIQSEIQYDVNNNNDITIDRDENNYNRYDFGGMLGLGIKFNTFFIDARLSRGFNDFDKERMIDSAIMEARDLQNYNFQLTAGYGF